MKRFLIPALMLALFAPIGFTGCAEKTEATKTETLETPGGTTTVEQDTTVKKTGEHKDNE